VTGFVYLKDVVTLKLNQAVCNGCGNCLIVCPRGVFAENGPEVRIADRDACIECGACSLNCPESAIEVEAGVGCAAAVINAALGRTSSACCCSIEPDTGCC